MSNKQEFYGNNLNDWVINHNHLNRRDEIQLPWIQDAKESKNEFKAIIKRAMREYGMTQYRDIVRGLGVSDETEILKKTRTVTNIINEKGRTDNRDRIIAICIVVGLSRQLTDFALRAYGLCPLFDDDKRDKTIIEAIYGENSFTETQNYLAKRQQRCLEVFEKHNSKHTISNNKRSKMQKISIGFTLKAERKDCYIESYQDDISSMYSPRLLTSSASACIQEKKDNKLYNLKYVRCPQGNGFELEDLNAFEFGELFSSPEECPILSLQDKCRELQAKAERAYTEAKDMLDDTKNYEERYDCRVVDGKMIIYVEVFNHIDPMSFMYYQMKKVGDNYIFTATNRSEYLKYHLGEKEYYQFYEHRATSEPLLKFESIEDINKQYQKLEEERVPLEYILEKELTLNCYKELKKKIGDIAKKIKSHKLKVFDTSVFDEPQLVAAEIFNVKDKFSWFEDEVYGRFANEDSFLFKLNDGRIRQTTMDELLRAIEVGIYNIEDLRMILTKYDSIEAFIGT